MQYQGQPWLVLNSQIVDIHRQLKNANKDKEAVSLFMKEHVEVNSYIFASLEEQLQYMVEQGYYEEDFLRNYSLVQIGNVFDYACKNLAPFASFTAAAKAYQEYVIKERNSGQYLESFADRLSVVALYHADGDYALAMQLIESLVRRDFVPATPTLLNTGRKQRGEFVSCFLLEMGDSLNDINRTIDFAGQLSKLGGGVAINFANLRARGDSVNGYMGASKGVVPLAKLFDVLFRYVDQQGQRPGAGVAYLPIFHADVLEFLSAKKINTDQDSRLTTLSIGLTVPSKFIELFKAGKEVPLFSPHAVYQAFGVTFSEVMANFDAWYDRLTADSKLVKQWVSSSLIMETILQSWAQSGYPYIFFIDNANDKNMLDGSIRQSNLCTEIMQIAKTSSYSFYHKQTDDVIGSDVTCTLASGHIEQMMAHNSIQESVWRAMKILDSVNRKTAIDHVPGIAKGNRELRSVGFGMMGLHGFLVKHDMQYGDAECLEFVDVFFNAVNYWSLRASCDTAKEFGAFVGFEQSGYADGRYFADRQAIYPTLPKVQAIFKGIKDLPRQEDWLNLAQEVAKYGLYHGYRLAIAPTGSISYIMSATPTLTPVKNVIEERVYSKSRTFYPAPHLDDPECAKRYINAYDTKKRAIIDTLAVIQKHIDQGISFEICINSHAFKANDLVQTLLYAHQKGLKSLYYIRINKMQMEECMSCQI